MKCFSCGQEYNPNAFHSCAGLGWGGPLPPSYPQYPTFLINPEVAERCRPCMLLRPRLSIIDGRWRALYGDVAGFGASPELAYLDFDRAWREELVPSTAVAEKKP